MKSLFENWREFLDEEESNLFKNIRAKRKRGEKPAKKGDPDYPDEESWEKATKKESVDEEVEEIEEKIDKDKMPCNKPRTTDSHKGKSHVVKACEDGKEKIIPFGEKGASTAGKPKKGESEKMKKKRKSFKARHAKNIAKGKCSAAYWANKVKW